MSANTKIEWTESTWNPVTGCSVVSAGCKNCYAMKLAGTRLQHHPSRAGLTVDTPNGPVWTGEVRFNENWLDQPIRWRKPRKIFVCAHSDLFHENVPDEWIDRVFAVMGNVFCKMDVPHTFQVLTKRAGRMRRYLSDVNTVNRVTLAMKAMGLDMHGENAAPVWPLPNVHIGVSVENQDAAYERIPLLLQTPAAVRWVSAEPLLGIVDLSRWILRIDHCGSCGAENETQIEDVCPECDAYDCLISSHGEAQAERYRTGERYDDSELGRADIAGENPTIDWVVLGFESGVHARPGHPDWARSLRDQCKVAGIPFLFKQWGEWAPNCLCDTDHACREIKRPTPGRMGVMFRCGKKAAGRLLDGVQYDGYPE